MKISSYLKSKIKKPFWLAIFILTIFYLSFRLVNFREKMTFHFDQGMHLLEVYEMVQEKDIRLIGPQVISKSYMGRYFFIGPQYYYILAVLGIILSWNPLSITIFLFFVELIFLLLFTFWLRKEYGEIEALAIYSLFTFSPFFIIHSRFFWNPHFLYPLGLAAVFLILRYFKTGQSKALFALSFVWGLAFSFHFVIAVWLPIFAWLVIKKKTKFTHVISIPLFFIIGDLPYILFELKNNFYNTRTFFYVFKNAHFAKTVEPHYVVYPLLPVFILAVLFIFAKIEKISKKLVYAFLLILTVSCMQNYLYSDRSIPFGHPAGWTYPLEEDVVGRILVDDCADDMNVASTVGDDTRAMDLRFLLTKEDCVLLGVEDYPQTKVLYLVAPPSRHPKDETVWEVSSLGDIDIEYSQKFNDKVILYKINKL